jgi:cytochrome c553
MTSLTGGIILSGLFSLLAAAPADSRSPTPEQAAFFEKNVQPVLASRCSSCHSVDTRTSGGLSLDNREMLVKGGNSGPAIVPGKPDESVLVRRITSTDTRVRMPLGDDPLPANEIADLRKWIEQGAVWPPKTVSASPVARASASAAKGAAVAYPRPATAEQLAYFEKKVRPIFVNRCYNCHSDAFKEAGGLRVDVGIGIFAGSNSGPVIVPGFPEDSTLIKRIKATDPKKRMPQESTVPLPPEEIAVLETWIKDGAAWPDETEKLPDTPAKILARYQTQRATHWAWQPIADPKVPAVANTAWLSSDVDAFILAKLAEKKLAPVKDADPDTLIRRLTYDLTGLPPSPSEIKAFEKDHSPEAYGKLVDRLLASPQYGERWGRHWLDVARYAESSGPSRNMPYPNAWRYRDYVIDAFNRDTPFNRFIQEQLAGDMLPAETPVERDRLLIATGFLALGPKDVNQRFKARFKMDNVDDQIDTVTRSTMALTVSCARCHDHKFDPIPTKDYYALAGIFTSTEDAVGLTSRMGGSGLQYYAPKLLAYMSTASQAPPVPADRVEKLKTETEGAKKAFEASKENRDGSPLTAEQKKQSEALEKAYNRLNVELTLISDPGDRGYGIHSVRDAAATDATVRIRGVEERHGPVVPRAFLSLVSFPDEPIIPADHSGRLELAQYITSPENPLTPRVYVNRVWQHLFGTGIVSTVDNFGSMGDKPANAALLDYLARKFIRDGWSTRKLVREIVLSHAYRLGTEVPPGYSDVDPADRLIWRHAPRRLEAEEVRDSLLAAAGQLDLDRPAGSPSMALRMIEIRDDGPAVASILNSADRSRYRSVYLPLLRGETPRAIAAFDPVVQTLVTGQREATTVPTQSLFMLNSSFARRESLILAENLFTPEYANDAARIREAYELVLGRDPNVKETAKVRTFLEQYSATWLKAHPGSGMSSPARPARTEWAPGDVTAGVERSDGLTQDQEIFEVKAPTEDPSLTIIPGSAVEAAWGAFVQALYGSAEFQFVR